MSSFREFTRRSRTLVLLALAACASGETRVAVEPPPPPCRVSVSPSNVSVTNTLASFFTISALDCERVDISGPNFPATVSVARGTAITVPAGTMSGPITVTGSPYTEGLSKGTVDVRFLRPVGLQVDRTTLPAQASTNSTLQYRLVTAPGTTCETSWTGPWNLYSNATQTTFPTVRTDAADARLVTVTMPSYAYSQPIRFRTDCTGEDGSVAHDSVGIQSTTPLLTAIDSIVPRTIPHDIPETFRIYSHGCPFASWVGQRGAPDATDGTLYLVSPPNSGRTLPDDVYAHATYESCNTVTFQFGMIGAATGEKFNFYLRNPGQPSVVIPMAMR